MQLSHTQRLQFRTADKWKNNEAKFLVGNIKRLMWYLNGNKNILIADCDSDYAGVFEIKTVPQGRCDHVPIAWYSRK